MLTTLMMRTSNISVYENLKLFNFLNEMYATLSKVSSLPIQSSRVKSSQTYQVKPSQVLSRKSSHVKSVQSCEV